MIDNNIELEKMQDYRGFAPMMRDEYNRRMEFNRRHEMDRRAEYDRRRDFDSRFPFWWLLFFL